SAGGRVAATVRPTGIPASTRSRRSIRSSRRPNRANAGCTTIPTTPSRNIDGEALRSDGDSALGRCQHCVRRNDLSELIVQRRHYGAIDLVGAQVTAIEVLVLPGRGCIGYHEDIESQVFCHARCSVDAVFRHHSHDYEGLLLRRAYSLFQVCTDESAAHALADHRFAGEWLRFRFDLVPGLAWPKR